MSSCIFLRNLWMNSSSPQSPHSPPLEPAAHFQRLGKASSGHPAALQSLGCELEWLPEKAMESTHITDITRQSPTSSYNCYTHVPSLQALWVFQDLGMEVLYHLRPYSPGYSPFSMDLYGRYLQFRFLKWSLTQRWTLAQVTSTIWLFKIAMENPKNKWRFYNRKIIYEWAIYTMAMLSNQRVSETMENAHL